tara:strand:+ start:98 stop:331 length:234 start_codon:yes stop_codon:yes gene_type:complete
MGRGKICYVLLIVSLFFFLTSVCTFAVLAVTKDPQEPAHDSKIIDDYEPHVGQHIIIERLKALEKRMKKKKNKRNRK